MQLSAFGWGDTLQQAFELLREAHPDLDLKPARVTAEHRGAYELVTAEGPLTGELAGRLRHLARDRLDLPGVGDWVALDGQGRIEAVLPRKSVFVRKAVGPRTEPQVIAANIDRVFIVTSADQDFNPRRVERYLAAVREGHAEPVLVINKIDLCADVEELLRSLGNAALGLPVARISALGQAGREQLEPHLGPDTTIALVGSSGVGKSTLVNWLLGSEQQGTAEVIARDGRGRHTTTHRELIPLPGGGALIDTPGMKEFGLWSEDEDWADAFGDIQSLAQSCKFADCRHAGEPGCEVARAIADGELDAARLAHYLKLEREIAHQRDRGSLALRQAQKRTGALRSRALRQRKRGPEGGKLS